MPTNFLQKLNRNHSITNIISIWLLLTNILSSEARVNCIDGVYSYSNDRYIITISKDSFNIYSTNSYWGPRMEDTNIPIAKCKIDKQSNDFYKIESRKPYYFEQIFDSLTYKCEVDETTKSNPDSVFIDFFFPNVETKQYSLYISTLGAEATKPIIDKHCSFKFKSKLINTLIIEALEPISYRDFNIYGQYLGVLRTIFPTFNDKVNKIQPHYRTKRLLIEIPGLTDYLFEQIFINGEFIKFHSKDEFEWRNMRFKKLDLKQTEDVKRIYHIDETK